MSSHEDGRPAGYFSVKRGSVALLNRVVLDNGWVGGVQVSTGYNHMSSYIVSTGQWVSRGQVIGYIGTTGLSTGCHLHFHTWINGQVSDPLNYL